MYIKHTQDPATKYHGHLLLAHIIARFAIHKRIVLQVFHSLLKAHALEARAIVRQALDILTPVVPIRMEDANVSVCFVFCELICSCILLCKGTYVSC